MSEIKHVGRVKATNKKCLIAYRTLPGEAYSCLIVPTENMPDIYHDAVINLVESTTGQEAYEFAEALDRSNFPDGSRMLPWLHVNNRLIKAPTDAIEMTPVPNFTILLSELNQIIAEQRGVAVDDLSLKEGIVDQANKPKEEAKPTAVVTKVPEAKPEAQISFNTPEDQAKHYRSQADKLAKEAANFRRLAEELVPTKKKVQ
jgi:hypothetical protein